MKAVDEFGVLVRISLSCPRCCLEAVWTLLEPGSFNQQVFHFIFNGYRYLLLLNDNWKFKRNADQRILENAFPKAVIGK